MLAKIVACLDIKHGKVVKGTQFRQHEIMGDILELAQRYSAEGADELVIYDIAASAEERIVDKSWVNLVAKGINIPLCVAGGISTVEEAQTLFAQGASKISVNSPALKRPELIYELANQFGSEKIVVGIDSFYDEKRDDYFVYTLTGDETKTNETQWRTLDWVSLVEKQGAGEIVLNMMNQDGVRKGYDLIQLKKVRAITSLSLVASGGAGEMQHFLDAYLEANVDGTLGASAFHKGLIHIQKLKKYLANHGIEVKY